MNKAIETIKEAQDEVPDWQQLQDWQALEEAANLSIIADSVAEKQNIDPEAIINIMKMNQQTTRTFKPAPFKYAPDIAKFLKDRFEKSSP